MTDLSTGPPPARLDYANPRRREHRGPIWMAVGVILLVLASALFLSLVITPGGYSPEAAARTKCAANLSQIGHAIQVFAENHGGRFPDRLKELLAGGAGPQFFVCPDSQDSPASGATTRALESSFATRGHLSYRYVGKGLTERTAQADVAVMYEPLANHAKEGMNVLFGDGHVEWLGPQEAATLLKNEAACVRPLRISGTPTTSNATSHPAE